MPPAVRLAYQRATGPRVGIGGKEQGVEPSRVQADVARVIVLAWIQTRATVSHLVATPLSAIPVGVVITVVLACRRVARGQVGRVFLHGENDVRRPLCGDMGIADPGDIVCITHKQACPLTRLSQPLRQPSDRSPVGPV